MTPDQQLRHAIILKAVGFGMEAPSAEITADNVLEIYRELEGSGYIEDAEGELREGQVETKIPCEWSRHYESKSVASKMPDGTWVGWTYWFGGGNHGDPESIEWIEDAYDIDCVEEERLVTIQTFTKRA